MRGLRAAGSIRANSPKLKYHRLGRWMFIFCNLRPVRRGCRLFFDQAEVRIGEFDRSSDPFVHQPAVQAVSVAVEQLFRREVCSDDRVFLRQNTL